jgi:hypothetical protein
MIRNSLLLNPHLRPFSLREKGAKHALEVPRPEGEGLRVRVITPPPQSGICTVVNTSLSSDDKHFADCDGQFSVK